MMAVLYLRRNLPLPQWPYSVTVNTLISILVVITKTAILVVAAEGLSHLKFTWFRQQHSLLDLETYAIASRGPLGSCCLFLMLRHRHLVASIGAIVTLLALVIDPFAQQILRYYSCDMLDPLGEACLPRTILYKDLGQHVGAVLSTLKQDMQSAINAGVYSVETPKVPVICSTGNCTFPQVYHTVAMCNACFNITDQLTITGARRAGGINYSLPSGLYSLLDDGPVVEDEGPITNITWFIMQPTDPSALLANATFEMIFSLSDSNYTMAPWAATCNIYPCIKSYTSEVKKSVLTETRVGDTVELPTDDQSSLVDVVDSLSTKQCQHLLDQGYHIDADTHWIRWNSTAALKPLYYEGRPGDETYNGSDALIEVPMNCTYSFSALSSDGIASYLRQFFNGSIYSTSSAFGGRGVLQALYNDGNISFDSVNSSLAQVAESMTTTNRQDGDINWSQPVLGTVYIQDTCIHVRWGWFVFPATLVLITIPFLSLMMIDLRHDQEHSRDWKSSPLPMLFHGLEHNIILGHQEGRPVSIGQMTEMAWELQVQLRSSGDGWKFTKVS